MHFFFFGLSIKLALFFVILVSLASFGVFFMPDWLIVVMEIIPVRFLLWGITCLLFSILLILVSWYADNPSIDRCCLAGYRVGLLIGLYSILFWPIAFGFEQFSFVIHGGVDPIIKFDFAAKTSSSLVVVGLVAAYFFNKERKEVRLLLLNRGIIQNL